MAMIPVALHIEPLATRRPHAFVLTGPPVLLTGRPGVADCELPVARTLARLHRFLEETGEDAARRWPEVPP